VFVWAPEEEDPWPPGAASRWWLHQSLQCLDASLRAAGSRLTIRRGPSLQALRFLAAETGARAVHWSRSIEPAQRSRDRRIEEALTAEGWTVRTWSTRTLVDPEALATGSGGPYRVFTPFWRAGQLRVPTGAEEAAPDRIPAPVRWPASLPLAALELEPRIDWAAGIRAAWRPGESGAAQALAQFASEAMRGYPAERDRPDHAGTSRLSPHLHFGEISPRQVWQALQAQAVVRGGRGRVQATEAVLRQIFWREFAHHLLHHFPATAERPLRPEFGAFPWRRNAAALRAWREGRTGYPIVDAGMRELWSTGWMHNRVRMVVASFLVKHLLIPWREGARWFWDTLVDADLANNTLGWQWTAGCGADAAPYFRIFNPVLQGERFDPEGAYVRRWVPELARVPARWIHQPWAAPAGTIGGSEGYPPRIVEHAAARARALAAYARITEGKR
jgi:deoxyribodipyrimidine photo-lyase